MKPNLNKFFLFSFLLASCAVGTPDATPTSTITPTLTSTSTPTPSPTFTPTPDPAENWKNCDETQVGFNLDGKQEIIPAVSKSNLHIWIIVGGDLNNDNNVVARWNKKINNLEWKWTRNLELHLLEIGRPEKHYDFNLDSEIVGSIYRQFNVSGGIIRFTIAKDNNHRDRDYIRLGFARYYGKILPDVYENPKEIQSGRIFIELPSNDRIGELREIPIYDFIDPIE